MSSHKILKLLLVIILTTNIYSSLWAQRPIEITIKNYRENPKDLEMVLEKENKKTRLTPKIRNNDLIIKFKIEDSLQDLSFNVNYIKDYYNGSFVNNNFLIPKSQNNSFTIEYQSNGHFFSKDLIDYNKFFESIYQNCLNEQTQISDLYSIFEKNNQLSYDSIQSIKSKIKILNKSLLKKETEFIKKHPEKVESLAFLMRKTKTETHFENSDFEKTFDSLNDSLKNSTLGIECLKRIKILQDRFLNYPEVGKVSKQNIISRDLDGNLFDLQKLKGKKILLNFWFMGCAPCVMEIPDLKEIKTKYPEIELISISDDRDINKLKKFTEKKGMTWRQLHYEANIFKDFKINAYPTTIFIDENGVFQLIRVGMISLKDVEQLMK